MSLLSDPTPTGAQAGQPVHESRPFEEVGRGGQHVDAAAPDVTNVSAASNPRVAREARDATTWADD